MKKITLLLLVFALVSCEKTSTPLNTEVSSLTLKAIQAKPWYKELMRPCADNEICKLYIVQAKYEGQTVYFTGLTGPLCDCIFNVTLLNTEGETVKTYSGYEAYETFAQEVTEQETIYTCSSPVSYTTIAQGELYGAGAEGIDPQNILITTDAAWQALIARMNLVNNASDTFLETDIDFQQYQVAVAFDHVRPTSGYYINLAQIQETENQITITFQAQDSQSEINSQVITQPYLMLKLPKTTKAIVMQTE